MRWYDRNASRPIGGMVLVALLWACARAPVRVQYYYSPICPACEETLKAIEQLASLQYLSRDGRSIRLEIFDVVHSDTASDAFYRAMDEYRVAPERQRLPLLIVDGAVHSGLEEVEQATHEIRARLGHSVPPR